MDSTVRSQVVTGYSSSQHASPLLELTCHMGSHSVTCYPAEVTFQPLPQPKLVLDLATPEGFQVVPVPWQRGHTGPQSSTVVRRWISTCSVTEELKAGGTDDVCV